MVGLLKTIGKHTRRRGPTKEEMERRGMKPVNNPNGRPKGSKNKITQEMREAELRSRTAVQMVFQMLGGVQGMYKWATSDRRHLTVFYRDIYTKLIPLQVQGEINHKLDENDIAAASQSLERALVSLISQRRDGGEEAPTIIDARPNPDPQPQLVISGPAGTDTPG